MGRTLFRVTLTLLYRVVSVLTILGYVIAAPFFLWISWALEGNFDSYAQALRDAITGLKNPFHNAPSRN